MSRLLEVAGLDINHEDEYGNTAAHLASYNGQAECVKILAETLRVDWNKAGEEGKTPLFMTLEMKEEMMENGCEDVVKIISEQPNVDYNVKTEDGQTLAQIAVDRPDDFVVETFANLETFDCWNIPDKKGNTPIMYALKNRFTKGVEILLNCPRVDLNCRDKEGWSLVFRAIQIGNVGKKMSENFVRQLAP